MSKKNSHAYAHDANGNDVVIEEDVQPVVTEEADEAEMADEVADDVDDEGNPIVALAGGAVRFSAPDKFSAGYVMTATDAAHYSNFVRTRCEAAMNLASKRKKDTVTWDYDSAVKFYDEYVMSEPRKRVPLSLRVRDEALDRLITEIAESKSMKRPPADQIPALKDALTANAKFTDRIAQISEIVRAEMLAKKPRSKGSDMKVMTLDSLFD